MRLLAFDTSGSAISVVAAESGVPRAWRDEELGRGHAERILPLLCDVLGELGWCWRELELVAVATGPGNFTGIRAGIAVARALVLASGCAALGVGSLAILAESAADQAVAGQPIDAVVDARRGEVYAQRFDARLVPLTEPVLLRAEEFAATFPGPGILVGDAAATVARMGRASDLALSGARNGPTLARLVARRLADGEEPSRDGRIRPVYLRAPDARPGAGASLLSFSA